MKTRLIKGLLGVLVLAVSVLSAGGLVSAAELADRIVAIVNDDVITLSELNEAVVPYVQKIRGERYSPDTAREMRFKVREQVLNRMVDDLLTAQEAKRLNISVEQSEVDEYVERTKSQHALTEEDLRKALNFPESAAGEEGKADRERDFPCIVVASLPGPRVGREPVGNPDRMGRLARRPVKRRPPATPTRLAPGAEEARSCRRVGRPAGGDGKRPMARRVRPTATRGSRRTSGTRRHRRGW